MSVPYRRITRTHALVKHLRDLRKNRDLKVSDTVFVKGGPELLRNQNEYPFVNLLASPRGIELHGDEHGQGKDDPRARPAEATRAEGEKKSVVSSDLEKFALFDSGCTDIASSLMNMKNTEGTKNVRSETGTSVDQTRGAEGPFTRGKCGRGIQKSQVCEAPVDVLHYICYEHADELDEAYKERSRSFWDATERRGHSADHDREGERIPAVPVADKIREFNTKKDAKQAAPSRLFQNDQGPLFPHEWGDELVVGEIMKPAPLTKGLRGQKLVLVLDGVRYPDNVGSLFHSAHTCGFDSVFVVHDDYITVREKDDSFRSFHVSTTTSMERDELLIRKIKDEQGEMRGSVPEGVVRASHREHFPPSHVRGFECGLSRTVSPLNWRALSASGLLPGWKIPYQIANTDFLLHQIARWNLLPLVADASRTTQRNLELHKHSQPATLETIFEDSTNAAYAQNFAGVCLILGNESRGVSERLLREAVKVQLPMGDMVDSLNVGVAGGILMQEVRFYSDRLQDTLRQEQESEPEAIATVGQMQHARN